MRILVDLQGAQSESRFRGIGRLSRSMAKAILRQNSEHTISILFNGALTDNIEDLKADFNSLLPREQMLTFHIPAPTAGFAPENAWRARASELVRETYIAQQRPDMVYITSVFEGFLDGATTSIGLLDAPHATAATMFDLIPLLNPEKYLTDERYQSHYLRQAQGLKRANLLLALSQSSRQEAITALDIAPEIIEVTGCGVDKDFHPLNLSSMDVDAVRRRFDIPRPFILYVGAVDPRKNVSLLLEAFSKLPALLRASHCLAFAGAIRPEEVGQLRMMGARFGLQNRELAFCGHVSDRDLVQLFNCASTFVFPSRHEGFGLPVLEAMACGTPVLVANATSLPEVVGRADLMFDPDDAEDLSAKLGRMLGNEDDLHRLRDWAIERAAAFTWEACAGRVLSAFERLNDARTAKAGLVAVPPSGFARKKTLAFVSPLPSDRSGISDYSARLLRELARFYDIECIISGTHVTDPWILANFPLRDIGWLERNALSYDRILYSFGNSSFHAHMLELLERYPGVVLLHDFYLSDLIDWMSKSGETTPDRYYQELYLTHGFDGLMLERREGRSTALEKLACNDVVFRNATGIIVHSDFVVHRACEIYGAAAAQVMTVIPFLQGATIGGNRHAARRRLGIAEGDFVVCSFGLITWRKQTGRLVDAWLASNLSTAGNARLVLVGENGGGTYGDEVAAQIAERAAVSRIALTGYVSREVYQDYIDAADLAVQLRTGSRGETSAAVLDCMAAGIPVILNAHGPGAEIDAHVVDKLPDEFTLAALSSKLDFFFKERKAAAYLGERGRKHVSSRHAPKSVAQAFYNSIETFEQTSQQALQRTALRALSDFHAPQLPEECDYTALGVSLSRNTTPLRRRQILFDVTVLSEQDAKTGIQRVVRGLLTTMINSPPADYRIEPVRIVGNNYHYARRFAARTLKLHTVGLPDSVVEGAPGDIFLGIDWVPDRLPRVGPWFQRFRACGGRVVIGVYDLLPLQMPQYFPDFMEQVTQSWFKAALQAADQLVCISRTVADDVERFAHALGRDRPGEVAIDYFHIGNDLAASLPSRGLASNAAEILRQVKGRRTFLMVGTVEPRKCHRQVIEAFETLWRLNTDVNLVIVGKKGWMIQNIEGLVGENREYGKRLFWLKDISDEMLDLLYAEAAALIAASMGEGFGLPLIEAAGHKVPLIARDIPVFREVAGKHAFYFSGKTGEDLARALTDWMALSAQGRAPSSKAMPYQTWQASTEELCRTLFAEKPYKRLEF